VRSCFFAASVALAALAASASPMTVRIAPTTIPAGTMEKTISIDVHSARRRLIDPHHDVTLELDVEAERSPQVFYEVWLSAPKGKRYNAGNIVLYGAGIRSEAHGAFHPAHVQLIVSDAIRHALKSASTRTLEITFHAKGAEGAPPAKPAEALVIRNAQLVVSPR
jgi:hypothetical protein